MADDANDAAAETATMTDGAAPADAVAANDGGALDAGGGHDASTSDAGGKKAPAAGGGCGCAFDADSSSRGAGGVLFLALACAATARRRRTARVARRARRGLLGLFTLVLAWLAFAPSAHAAYGFRKALTIDRTRIGTSGGATTLTNYPLLIVMTDPVLKTAPTGHVQTGFDIAFKGADTTTCNGPSTCTFNSEIESYDGAGGTVIAWVNIPVLKTTANTANTVIYINYGDSSITTSQNSTSTWDTNFRGVWHLNQSTPTTENDSTASPANATSATDNGATAATSAGALIGSGISMSSAGTGGAYYAYNSSKFDWLSTDTFTYSGWFKTGDANGPLLSQRDGTGNPVIDICLGYDGSTSTSTAGAPIVLVRDNNNGTFAEVPGTTAVNDSAWHLFTVTRTGGTIQLYIDAGSINSATNTGASAAITTSLGTPYQNIGREGNWVSTGYGAASNDARYLAGTFDEYRVSNTIRSVDWITTDYKTQLTPGSTFTASGEALASCSNGVIDAGEACDDGNVASGDGCSGLCAVETGYTCSGTPSSCHTNCGDGILAGIEQCDDGNNTNGDGCNSICNVEGLYHCTQASPSICVFAEFDYYKTITVNKGQVGTPTGAPTLSNYPVLFSVVNDASLKSTTNGGRVRDTMNGNDIIFQGVDTTTCGGPKACQLIHEVEKWDPSSGTFVAWVRVPTLNTAANTGASTSFRILIGNKAITTSSTTPSSVWDSSFTSVYPLNHTTTSTMNDSTSNANNGAGTALTSTSGQMGLGVSTDGSTSFLALGGSSALNVVAAGSFTYSTWLNTSDTAGGILSMRQMSGGGIPVIDLMVGYDGLTMSASNLLAIVRDQNGNAGEMTMGGVITGAWHLVTLTLNNTALTLYVDATQKQTQTGAGGVLPTDIRNLGREGYWTTVQPGYTTADNEFLAATFDEVRVSNTARSIDWITTDYNAQSSPSAFITYTPGSGGEVATNSSTDVSLASFDANASCTGTTVSWETAYEVDTLGFNVYRVAGRSMAKVSTSLVAGAGLTGGGAHHYELVDPAAPGDGAAYELETVHLDLASTWDGPVPAHGGCSDATTTPPVSAAASVGLGDPARAGAAPSPRARPIARTPRPRSAAARSPRPGPAARRRSPSPSRCSRSHAGGGDDLALGTLTGSRTPRSPRGATPRCARGAGTRHTGSRAPGARTARRRRAALGVRGLASQGPTPPALAPRGGAALRSGCPGTRLTGPAPAALEVDRPRRRRVAERGAPRPPPRAGPGGGAPSGAGPRASARRCVRARRARRRPRRATEHRAGADRSFGLVRAVSSQREDAPTVRVEGEAHDPVGDEPAPRRAEHDVAARDLGGAHGRDDQDLAVAHGGHHAPPRRAETHAQPLGEETLCNEAEPTGGHAASRNSSGDPAPTLTVSTTKDRGKCASRF